MIKARVSGDNENVFHWKYLLSKKNRVTDKMHRHQASLKKTLPSSIKPRTYGF